jgi:hypothetical protein
MCILGEAVKLIVESLPICSFKSVLGKQHDFTEFITSILEVFKLVDS